MHILYITFGNNYHNYTQAYFSMYSFWANNIPLKSINIVTDQPSFYASVSDKVNIIEVNKDILEEWKGVYQFFWRIKIKAIEKVCAMYSGEPVLYLDCDTFLYNAELLKSISCNSAIMFENEGTLKTRPSKTQKKMAKDVSGLKIAGLENLADYAMWNAGVVFTPNNVGGKEVELALTLCDEMSRHHVTETYIEQFALSVALTEVYGLKPATEWIAHYWSAKDEWNNAITSFFLNCKMRGLTFEEELENYKGFDLEKYPVVSIAKNTRHRLKKLVDKMFPYKKLEYVSVPKA